MRNEGRRVATVLGALPLGWATATIGEIIGCDGLFVDGDWVESKDQDPKGDVRLTQLADVGDGVYRNRSNRFLKYERAVQLGCTFLQPNDLMVARMPDPLGRACVFPGDSKPSVTVVDVCIVRTGVNGADHQWLMHTINSPTFRSTIASLQSGSTRKRISRSNLAKIEFPVSPLPEQYRIAAKIEEFLTKLDAGVEALNKIKLQLKQYRQAVLKHAFEGKLTEEWREDHKDELEPAAVLLEKIKAERTKHAKGKVKELLPTDIAKLPKLPQGWVWTTLHTCSAEIYRYPTFYGMEHFDTGVPVIRGEHINNDGTISHDWTDYWFVSEQLSRKFPRTVVDTGDLIMSVRGSVGKMGLADDALRGAQVSPNCLRISLLKKYCLPKLVLFYLKSLYGQGLIKQMINATTIETIKAGLFVQINIPLPPFDLPP